MSSAGETGQFHQHAFKLAPDATELILVRHGASAPAARGERFTLTDGWGDPPLAPEGERQAEAIAERLQGEPISAIFVSGLLRTVQTAAPLAARLDLAPVAIPELREVYVGDWEGGELRIRIAERDPLTLRMYAEERWDLAPNAESMETFAQRARAGIERIVAAAEPSTTVVVVVHAAIIGEICRQATGSRPFAFVHADNGSLSRLIVSGDGAWKLRCFNDTVHVAGAPTADGATPV